MAEPSLALHRYTIVVALFAFAAVLSGAFITSSQIVSGKAQVLPNSDLHSGIAITLAVLTLGLGVQLSASNAGRSLQVLIWSGFAALAIDGALGWRLPSLTPFWLVLHACLGHAFLACIAPIALMTSRQWRRDADSSLTSASAYLRPLATATPPAVFVQITLGAMYRYQIAGILPHMAGAAIVALLTLGISGAVLQNHPHSNLRSMATALISIVLAQTCLGIAVFIMLILGAGSTMAFAWIATAHVSIGSLTLAASVVMAIRIRRNFRVRRLPSLTA
jgi:hypothetical protein